MDRDIKFERAVGAKIRELRQALGWSQEYLASVAGMDKKQVQRVEQGDYSPYIKTVTGIAKALGRQPWEIFKVEYQVKVNANLQPQPRRPPGATSFVNRLAATNFFNSPRSVQEVVRECEVRYEIALKSSAVSGALKTLVDQKFLKGSEAPIKGRLLYQKPKKK